MIDVRELILTVLSKIIRSFMDPNKIETMIRGYGICLIESRSEFYKKDISNSVRVASIFSAYSMVKTNIDAPNTVEMYHSDIPIKNGFLELQYLLNMEYDINTVSTEYAACRKHIIESFKLAVNSSIDFIREPTLFMEELVAVFDNVHMEHSLKTIGLRNEAIVQIKSIPVIFLAVVKLDANSYLTFINELAPSIDNWNIFKLNSIEI